MHIGIMNPVWQSSAVQIQIEEWFEGGTKWVTPDGGFSIVTEINTGTPKASTKLVNKDGLLGTTSDV